VGSYKTDALVLRKTKLAETDLILTLVAADGSQKRAVAKGGRKPGSKLCGLSEPFVVLRGLFHEGRSLDILREAHLLDANYELRSEYERAVAAGICADFLTGATEPGEEVARLFDLSRMTLAELASAETDVLMVLVLAFLLKAMALLGYSPQYEVCAKDARLAQLFTARLAEVSCLDIKQRSLAPLMRKMTKFIDLHLPAHLKTLHAWR
jgi:DNA repair protein RecO (recombination protein O)